MYPYEPLHLRKIICQVKWNSRPDFYHTLLSDIYWRIRAMYLTSATMFIKSFVPLCFHGNIELSSVGRHGLFIYVFGGNPHYLQWFRRCKHTTFIRNEAWKLFTNNRAVFIMWLFICKQVFNICLAFVVSLKQGCNTTCQQALRESIICWKNFIFP